MTESISIRRTLGNGCVVNVTQTIGRRKVHWAERVLGPTPVSVGAAIRSCRAQCVLLWTGVEEAGDE